MDILRRNTDYALRAIAHLANHWKEGPVSTRDLANDEDITYQLACKIMQKLGKAKLVASCMGPKGGFTLNGDPSEISLLDVIIAMQGPVRLNRCLISDEVCTKVCVKQPGCPVNAKLSQLQGNMNDYLSSVTLDQLLEPQKKGKRKVKK